MNNSCYNELNIDVDISLSSLFTFSLRTFEKGYFYKGETHDFFEVVIVLQGLAGVTAGKNVYTLGEGQMVVHQPNQFHNLWTTNSDAQVLVFSFRATAFPKVFGVFALDFAQVEQIKEVYRQSRAVFDTNDVHLVSVKSGMHVASQMILLKLQLFLLQALETGLKDKQKINKGSKNYYHIVSVMETHLSHNLKVQQIAKLCNMSVANLEKTLLRYSGYGAKAFYNIMRMQRARELLLQGYSVKEAAFAVGYEDQNYFSARFKRWSGVAPSQVGKTSKPESTLT